MRFMPGANVIRGESELHWRPTQIRFALKFPARLWVAILMITLCLLALTLPIALSKSAEAPSDVFVDYVDFFPGQYWSTGLESAFRCNIDIPSGIKYCFFRSQKALFEDIGVSIIDGKITRIAFTLRQDTLKAGDLAALWGRPEIQIAGYIAYLDWQNQKIRAIARTDNARFDYFLPVSSVAFY
jgi:hypothetical protein